MQLFNVGNQVMIDLDGHTAHGSVGIIEKINADLQRIIIRLTWPCNGYDCDDMVSISPQWLVRTDDFPFDMIAVAGTTWAICQNHGDTAYKALAAFMDGLNCTLPRDMDLVDQVVIWALHRLDSPPTGMFPKRVWTRFMQTCFDENGDEFCTFEIKKIIRQNQESPEGVSYD